MGVLLKKTLLLFSNALVRLAILIQVDKATGVCISLHPLISFRIVNLAPIADSTITVPIAGFSISRHTV
jgi:hypothetical protein